MPLESDLELAELPRVAARAEIKVRVASDLPGPPHGLTKRHDWLDPDGHVSLSLSKSKTAYHLVFPGATRFTVSAAGDELIGCSVRQDTETLRHHLLGQVLPRVLAHRGRLVLHASAVVGPSGAIAILGGTGAGKSTLAAALLAHGCELVADDALVLEWHDEQLMAVPDPRGVRLLPAAAERLVAGAVLADAETDTAGKFRIARGLSTMTTLEPLPLVGAVLLQPSTTAGRIDVEPLPPATALMAFLEHSFHLDLWDRDRLARRLRDFGRVAEALPLSRLRFRHHYGDLTTLSDRVLARVTEPSRGGPAP